MRIWKRVRVVKSKVVSIKICDSVRDSFYFVKFDWDRRIEESVVLKIVLVMVEKCINREWIFSKECRIQLHF